MLKTHVVTIDGSKIQDFDTFHRTFKEVFGFPDFYGANMNAWIDCMGDIHQDTAMSNVLLPGDTALIIEVTNAKHISENAPEALEALSSCIAFVNSERIRFKNKNDQPIYLLLWN
jgi:RNAse (barnase) inhibitor barstar